ncbi:MAG TPA: hypothetical protein VEK08_24755 [Planctomycetota bacterium]|nr:hypothetical protein [Planctomycetota bacterium]
MNDTANMEAAARLKPAPPHAARQKFLARPIVPRVALLAAAVLPVALLCREFSAVVVFLYGLFFGSVMLVLQTLVLFDAWWMHRSRLPILTGVILKLAAPAHGVYAIKLAYDMFEGTSFDWHSDLSTFNKLLILAALWLVALVCYLAGDAQLRAARSWEKNSAALPLKERA